MKLKIFIIFLTIALINSCDTDDKPAPEISFNYRPLITGSEYIYKVDSINYLQIPVSYVTYWQREVVGEETATLDSNLYYEIEVYRKYTWQDDWIRVRTDLARNTELYSERSTENVIYRKLVYPINNGKTWQSTPNNDIDFLYGNGVDFSKTQYQDVHQVNFLGQRGLDSTLTVVQYERYDFINRLNFREKYANNIGLYKQVEMMIEYQDPNSQGGTDTFAYEAVNGYKRTQVIVDYNIPE